MTFVDVPVGGEFVRLRGRGRVSKVLRRTGVRSYEVVGSGVVVGVPDRLEVFEVALVDRANTGV